MSTKTVRLKEGVYERIKSKKRADETFSEAVDRLTRDVSLLDLVDEEAEPNPERAERMKRALEETEKTDFEKTSQLFDNDDS